MSYSQSQRRALRIVSGYMKTLLTKFNRYLDMAFSCRTTIVAADICHCYDDVIVLLLTLDTVEERGCPSAGYVYDARLARVHHKPIHVRVFVRTQRLYPHV